MEEPLEDDLEWEDHRENEERRRAAQAGVL
jgi:hypothetical protein